MATQTDGGDDDARAADPTAPPSGGDTIEITINWRRLVISAFVAWQIVAVAVWLLPDGIGRSALSPIFAPYMLTTGCWQSWTMFSPDPAKEDVYLQAQIHYGDGAARSWLFPRTSQLNWVQRYQRERFRKMFENANAVSSDRMWPYLARYAALENDRGGDPAAYPMTVTLVRHYRYIVPPPYTTPAYQTAAFYRATYAASPRARGDAAAPALPAPPPPTRADASSVAAGG